MSSFGRCHKIHGVRGISENFLVENLNNFQQKMVLTSAQSYNA